MKKEYLKPAAESILMGSEAYMIAIGSDDSSDSRESKDTGTDVDWEDDEDKPAGWTK